ncbi:MAG: hypothetical protein PHQ59_01355 [Candidatus Daviesbacteria bacterium]|nr:hypothetical protein [Candidatus Daviesbacteria bacterium]
MLKEKGFAPIIIILGIVLFLGIVGGVYYFSKNSSSAIKNNPVNTPTPTATLKVDETTNWKTYTNTEYGYSIKYPENISLEEMGVDVKGKLVKWIWIDKQIQISVTKANSSECKVDCPIISKIESVKIDNTEGKKQSGYISQIGGRIPQSFQQVIIPHNGSYFNISLYELKNDSIKSSERKAGTITEAEIKLFNQILSTFEFTK